MKKLCVTRDSVCTGDDVFGPHERTMSVPDDFTLDDVARTIQQAGYLPKIEGGKATWSVASGVPIAVIAEQWPTPKTVTSLEFVKDELVLSGRTIRAHVNYHAQIEPEVVLEVLRELKLRKT
jgi:hypothetical protein